MPAFISHIPYFEPTQISGCSLWFDAADCNTMTIAGGLVTSWTSKGSAVTSTSAVSGKTNPSYTTYNGRPALGFNGSTTNITTGNVTVSGTGTTWISCAVNLTPVTVSTPADASVVLASSSPEKSIRFDALGAANCYSVNSNTGNTGTVLRSDVNNNANGIRGFMDTGSYFTAFANGTSTVSNTTAVNYLAIANSPLTMGYWNIGYLNGYILETVVYNRVLTLAEYQQVEGYMAQKWGFTGSLPAGHPGLGATLYRWKIPFGSNAFFNYYSPSSISGLKLWFDAADSNMINISSGLVTSWTSKGTIANISTSAVAGGWKPPSYTTYNGRPALGFDGLSTYVQTNPVTLTGTGTTWITAAVNLTPIGVNSPVDASLVIACKIPEKSIRFDCNNNATCYTFNSNLTNTANFIRQDSNNNVNGIRGFIDTADYFTAFGNGTQTTSNISTVNYVNPTSQPFYMGAWLPGVLNGYIQEILVYDNTLTVSQYKEVEGYLAQKWGHLGSLPTNHPSFTLPAGAPTYWSGKKSISVSYNPPPVYGSVRFTYLPVSPYAGNQYLSASVTAPSTDSVTYECWFYQTTQNSGNNDIFSTRSGGGGNGGIQVGINTYWGGFSLGTPTFLANYGFAPSLNTWHHIALVRNGTSTWTFYYDGIAKTSDQGATFTFTSTTSTDIYIGAFADSGYPQQFTGYVTNFRYVKGVAVYTGNFTPPVSRLTAISGTQLLLNFPDSNFLLDSSSGILMTNVNTTYSATVPF